MKLPATPCAEAAAPQIIENLGADPRLERAWNELWRRAGGHCYEDYSVAAHCWEQIAKPAGNKLFCVLIWEDDRLVLAWPLVTFGRGLLRFIKPLSPCGGEAYSVLVDPQSDVAQAVASAWNRVTAECNCDIFYLPAVRADSPLHRVIPPSPRYVSRKDMAPFALLAASDDWNAYRRALAPTMRKEMDYKRRRLLRLPESEVVWIDPKIYPQRAMQLLDWILAEKQKWVAKARKAYTWVDSPSYRDFLMRSINGPDQTLKYLLCAVQVNKQPIAGILVAFCPTHVEGVIGAFDPNPSVSKLSPGSVLVEDVMKFAFQMRLNVDFGTGAEAFKLFWSQGNKVELSTYHLPLTRRGKFAVALRSQLHRLGRR